MPLVLEDATTIHRRVVVSLSSAAVAVRHRDGLAVAMILMPAAAWLVDFGVGTALDGQVVGLGPEWGHRSPQSV